MNAKIENVVHDVIDTIVGGGRQNCRKLPNQSDDLETSAAVSMTCGLTVQIGLPFEIICTVSPSVLAQRLTNEHRPHRAHI